MFPNSHLFAFVATCLFLANVGVEASPTVNPGADPSAQSEEKPTSITVVSSLSVSPRGTNPFGICSLPFAEENQVFKPATGPDALPVQKFVTEARKNGAVCQWFVPDDMKCVEQGGKGDMSASDVIWWQQAFCKRCSDAGGKNGEEFNCPDDSDSAETKVEEKKK
ncbi:hypothetical protein NDA11_001329 [Ustilago hordei]|nr:hypothetical protein NDA11_001329 [Ustilago hordei]